MNDPTIIPPRPTAAALNAILAAGGEVQVTTYARSVLYRRRNAGDFTELLGALYVRQGKGRVCLAQGPRLLVGITTRSKES